MKIFLATTNKAKIKYYGRKLSELGFDVETLKDKPLRIVIDENGNNPVENAVIKAQAYSVLSYNDITIAIDAGLYFENVPDEFQPGTHVRRVNGKYLTDEEMIEYYIDLVSACGDNDVLKGYFLKGIAIVYRDNLYTGSFKAERYFTNIYRGAINEGYPLDSIQIIPSLNKFKSELTRDEYDLIVGNEKKELFDFIVNTIQNIKNSNTKKLIKK